MANRVAQIDELIDKALEAAGDVGTSARDRLSATQQALARYLHPFHEFLPPQASLQVLLQMPRKHQIPCENIQELSVTWTILGSTFMRSFSVEQAQADLS